MDLKLDVEELVDLRHNLHANAEVSNQEEKTAQIIVEFLEKHKVDQIWDNLGGYGVIALIKGKEDGPNLGFRADMDALHIPETIELEYGSKTPHTAHKCGHDGHMTMVAAIASYLRENPLQKGNVYLIFQPAEETGEGAARMNKAMRRLGIKLDFIFGLHNLPGYSIGKVVSKKNTFAAASRGMVIKFSGRSSHAAEPEKGISPVLAMSEIMAKMTNLHKEKSFSDLTLATVIHAELGEITFGTSPSQGVVRVTLRAMQDKDMRELMRYAEDLVKEKAKEQRLEFEISYTDIFTATENTEEAFDIIKSTAEKVGLDFKELEKPFKWSEDFGQYKLRNPNGFFGLGVGEDCPHLHDEAYDFPDDVIPSGLKMYAGIIKKFDLN